MSLLFVALGAILLWFIIAPFLKPAPAMSPKDFDPRVTCAICDRLCNPDQIVEREMGSGRFQMICGECIAALVRDYTERCGALPEPPSEEPDPSPAH